MASTQAPSRIRPTPLLARCRRPWTGWVQVLAAVMMILSPLPSSWASWSDTDSDALNDTWTDPVTSQVTTLADLNLQSTDADSDGATNDEEAAEGTDPFSYDTDYDGISDGDELHIVKPILGVSLTAWDSDGDYVSDYDEWHSFSAVVYTDGQLPALPGASYSDYDGDGAKNPFDPFPTDPENYSSINNTSWYGDVFGDADADGALNWEDSEPYNPAYADSDGDGIEDSQDPFPYDGSNYSSTNGITWYGDVLGDADSDNNLNWQDSEPYGPASSDSDSDGIDDSSDPFPGDSANYSATNNTYWYGDVFGDSDSDGTLNWEDSEPYGPASSDSDGDGIEDGNDPFPYDSSNYSSANGISWYGDVLSDGDSDGILNWEDADPWPPTDPDSDNDGISDAGDPFPYDDTNYSPTNGIAWYGNLTGDEDSDGILNWEDPEPYNPTSMDSDSDGIEDATDPYPYDSSNLSNVNQIAWYSDVLGDLDNDGMPNWEDPWPENPDHSDMDGDGLLDSEDPFPQDAANYSSINQIEWYGSVLNDDDVDGVVNWQDEWPYDPTNSGGMPDYDGDGLDQDEENTHGTSDEDPDCDDDGLTDYEELMVYSTDPLNPYTLSQGQGWGELYTDYELVDGTDTDGDGIPDRIEEHYGMLPNDSADGMGDLDGNGINNLAQYNAGLALNVDLSLYDADADGLTDIYEDYYGLNKYVFADAMGDSDNDGVLNFEESKLSLSPVVADTLSQGGLGDLGVLMEAILYPGGGAPFDDTDSDGIADWMEDAQAGSSPVFTRQTSTDLDGDGMPDVWEHRYGRWKYPADGLYVRHNDATGDPDDDALPNLREFQFSMHPLIADTDGDGTEDGGEDPDGDGLTNAQEIVIGTDAWDTDSDDDGHSDGAEQQAGSDPLNAGSTPEDPGGSGGSGGSGDPPPTPEEETERAVFTAVRQKQYVFSGVTALPEPPPGEPWGGEKWYITNPVNASSDALPAHDGFNGDASLDDNLEDPNDPRDEGDDTIPDDGMDSNYDGDNDDPNEPTTVRVEVEPNHEGAEPEPYSEPTWLPYASTPSASQNFSHWRVHNLMREVPPLAVTSSSAWEYPRDAAARMSAITYHRPGQDAAAHGWRGRGADGVGPASGGGSWFRAQAPNIVDVETNGQTSSVTVMTDSDAVQVDYTQVRLQTNLIVPEDESISRTFLIVERTRNWASGGNPTETSTLKGTVTLTIPEGKKEATEASTTGDVADYVQTIGGFKVIKLETEPEAANTQKFLDLLPVEIVVPDVSDVSPPLLAANGGGEPFADGGAELAATASNSSSSTPELVNFALKPATELKVAKLEHSLNDQHQIEANKDHDCFYVRIPKFKIAGITHQKGDIKVKISTKGATDSPEHNDPAGGWIDLDPVLGMDTWISPAQLLVSDKGVDDLPAGQGTDYAADEQANDRTHVVELGGTVVIERMKILIDEFPLDIQLPVKKKREVPIKAVCMADQAVNASGAKQYLKISNERLAQVGVKLKYTDADITTMAVPTQHMSSSDVMGVIKPSGAVRYTLGPEPKALVDTYKAQQFSEMTANDIVIFFCDRVRYPDSNPVAGQCVRGMAVFPSYSDSSGAYENSGFDPPTPAYANKIFVSGQHRGVFTTAHEIAHCLTDHGHYGVDYNPDGYAPEHHKVTHNLMRRGTTPTEGIDGTKRLYKVQETLIFPTN